MSKLVLASLIAVASLGNACNGSRVITGCGLCALQPTLVATGLVRASVNPIAGAVVTLTAYRDSCGGAEVTLLPAPTTAQTDSTGRYVVSAQPTAAVAAACLRVAYSSALYSDLSGVSLRLPPATEDTVHIDVTGP